MPFAKHANWARLAERKPSSIGLAGVSSALEIRASLGKNDKGLDDLSPSAVEKIRHSVINNIYGGVNIIVWGKSQVNNTVSNSQDCIRAGDRDGLINALRSAGIPEESVGHLPAAIEGDGERAGERVKSWVKENASHVLVGGVKVATAVGQALLTDWLKLYLGA